MIHIICKYESPRLVYVLDFIFGSYFSLPYKLLNEADYRNPNLHYDDANGEVYDCGLLAKTGIEPIEPQVVWKEDIAYLHFTEKFDLFAAVFYLLSRYEEYLPFEPDEHGRFPAEASLAFRKNFLHLPLVNIWLNELAEKLRTFGFKVKQPAFSFRASFDIDMAFAHSKKGFARNIGGLVKSPKPNRVQALLGKRKDTYDIFEELTELHFDLKQEPLYFFLLAKKIGGKDKNNPRDNPAMKSLIQGLDEGNEVGIHPSYKSFGKPEILKEEIAFLAATLDRKITKSRQHFLRFRLPETYRNLIDAGIEEEYSMGYATRQGFRASVAHRFLWYDLAHEKATSLRVFPFAFMDATAYYQLKQSTTEAFEELNGLLQTCLQHGGELITLFHNSVLSREKEFAGWFEAYANFINRVKSLGY